MVQRYLDVLGKQVEDKVTGMKGVAISVSFDIAGCVQVYVRRKWDPKVDDDKQHGAWIDHKRLTITTKAAMPVPDFGSPPGASEIRAPRSGPHR